MGAVRAYTWKELIEQAEIAEKSAKKFESSTSRRRTNNKDHDTTESSDTNTLAVKISWSKKYQRQYSFKDKHVVTTSTCSTKTTSWSFQMLDAQMKLDVQMIPTIVFFIGWFIILLAGAMSLRTKFKYWFRRVFWLQSQNKKGPMLNLYPKKGKWK